MKKKLIAIIFLLAVTVISYSQNHLVKSAIQTTTEEYKFLTERYNIDENVEMLEGYELKPLGFLSNKEYSYNYQLFIESKTKKVKAVYVIITKIKKSDDKVRYLCIPINNDELFKEFDAQSFKLGATMMVGFYNSRSMLISSYIDYRFNSNRSDIKTTNEEYKFMTEQYSPENNINLLDGYELKHFEEEVFEEKYTYNYKLLVDSKSQYVKAILIKIVKLKMNDTKIKYLCMPINNNKLYNEFNKVASKLGVNIGYFFSWANFSLLSKFIDDKYNSN